MTINQKTAYPRERKVDRRPLPRRTAAWAILLAAGLLEIAWSLALKEAGGLERPEWAAVGIGLAMISLGMLAYALGKLPVGTAYAVWVGIGTVGVTLAGMLFLQEPVEWPRLIFLALIIAGVIGLGLDEQPGEAEGSEDASRASHS
ncbi:quaternary ammonium compound-resistance protein SugE [Natronospira proteinivora]|uniref:Guanidinium exporter n=1 Tax=Natronospira proteinivora TaxID=1807133 RepID=A0ABT1G6J7_9GAMM|nr:multidrug efflux SMR transporter [Natronospira proteinivora]MCP1726580.1 quaternary ammonium compound-resistance protein SugE [Natronospira proteinivora]